MPDLELNVLQFEIEELDEHPKASYGSGCSMLLSEKCMYPN
jgi:hypothetical protein